MNISDVNLDELTKESVPFQFCSDYLKEQILKLIEQRDIARDTLEYFADSSKWKESTIEPMKSLGFKPSMLARQALDKMKLK
jgi:hypothetical protein